MPAVDIALATSALSCLCAQMAVTKFETMVRDEIDKLGRSALELPVEEAATTAARLHTLRGHGRGLLHALELYKRATRIEDDQE